MTGAELLIRGARISGSAPIWRYGERSTGYREFVPRVARIAGGLGELGLRPGDRVVLDVPNCPEFLELLWASLWAGLVAVPVNWHLHASEIEYLVGDCGASAILVREETVDHLALLDERVRRLDVDGRVGLGVEQLAQAAAVPERHLPLDTPAWLFYTSGTTGRPKGATLTHRNLMTMAMAYYADVDPVAASGIYLHAAPLSHGSGLYSLPIVGHGATNVIYPLTRFDADLCLELITAEKVTNLTFVSPTMLMRLVDAAEQQHGRPASLRSIVVGGAPLYKEDLVRAQDTFGPIIQQMYGQGESPMTIAAIGGDKLRGSRLGSCGRPLVGVSIRVVDSDGTPVTGQQPGEVLVSSDAVMAGYWNNATATASTVVDGWLHTGDVGYLDADGYLFLTDRVKDVIITGGTNVYPREVEEILLSHPAVAETCVIGIPDADWGEAICAIVVRAPGAAVDADDLIAFCRERQASFKKPRHVRFVEALPKNATGKVLKRELQQLIPAQAGARDREHPAP